MCGKKKKKNRSYFVSGSFYKNKQQTSETKIF